MRRPITTPEFKALRRLIREWCGVALEDNKAYLVESRLGDLLEKEGCATFAQLCERTLHAGNLLRDAVIDRITTQETSWFRDRCVFQELLGELLLPEALRQSRQEGRAGIRIWSAACSTGQEPYSIAMLLRELERSGRLDALALESVEILASDVSVSALERARAGRYRAVEIERGLEADLRARYFEPAGQEWVLAEDVRKLVRFERFNLLDPFASLGSFDIVLLRNVLIYFDLECKKRIVRKIGNVLQPEGALLVGGTETLETYTAEFRVVRHERACYYQPDEERL
jgi:chemotaxis protein methyltransferase CheR